MVIQTAFIGDVVLATALVEKLHQQFPVAKIDFLVRKGNEALLINHPFLNEVLVWDKQENKYKNLLRLIKKIRQRKYDKVINVQRFAATGILTVLSGGKMTIGFDKNPLSGLFNKKIIHEISTGDHYIHEVDRNQKLIAFLTDAAAAKPRLYPSLHDYEKVRGFQSSPYVCIAPASVWFTKQYPKQKWVDLINQLNFVYDVYLLGAPDDTALCEEIKAATVHTSVVNLAGKLTFLQSAALQQAAVMNYVNDSAPMHFASSVNAPVTAIYCSTVPAFGFGPLSDKSFVVQTREQLACKPCGLHGYKSCPLKHFKCAHTIGNDQLLEKFARSLGQ